MRRIQRRKLELQTLTIRVLENVRGGVVGDTGTIVTDAGINTRQCNTENTTTIISETQACALG